MTHFGKEVAFDQPGEILKMGGPWAGTLTWGGDPVTSNVLVDSLVADKHLGRLYFVRCHIPTHWRRDVMFQIGFVEGDRACTVSGYVSSVLPILSVSESGVLSARVESYEPRPIDTSGSSCHPLQRPQVGVKI